MPNEKEQKESENEETVEAYYCGAIVVITTALGSIRRVVNVVVDNLFF
jgi:cysteinyl-tRNA synthetase